MVRINGIEFCEDEEHMGKVAREFAKKSNIIIFGCIGATDGWIVTIKKPSTFKDLFKMSDPASYFSRKGFFGINVQAIVDSNKSILYRTLKSHGVEQFLLHSRTVISVSAREELADTCRSTVLVCW